jgi:hypothetical protein
MANVEDKGGFRAPEDARHRRDTPKRPLPSARNRINTQKIFRVRETQQKRARKKNKREEMRERESQGKMSAT